MWSGTRSAEQIAESQQLPLERVQQVIALVERKRVQAPASRAGAEDYQQELWDWQALSDCCALSALELADYELYVLTKMKRTRNSAASKKSSQSCRRARPLKMRNKA